MRIVRRAVATLCALLGAQGASMAQAAPKVTMAVVGGRIIDGYGGPVLENGVILMGTRPWYRWQNQGAMALAFNAIANWNALNGATTPVTSTRPTTRGSH